MCSNDSFSIRDDLTDGASHLKEQYCLFQANDVVIFGEILFQILQLTRSLNTSTNDSNATSFLLPPFPLSSACQLKTFCPSIRQDLFELRAPKSFHEATNTSCYSCTIAS